MLAIFSLFGTLGPGALWIVAAIQTPGATGTGIVMGILWMLWGGMWTAIWAAFAVPHHLRSKR